jgi:ribonuclease D
MIAVDTEFIWRDTYFPILSLIQISSKKYIYIIDALTIDRFKELNKVFLDNNICKIFHSMRSDISVLNSCIESNFKNVFDTQIAESLLNNNDNFQIGYKAMVNKYFYRNLPKTETNSKWDRRPLSDQQLSYAADDVRFLIDIKKAQQKKLFKKKLSDKSRNLFENELITAEKKFSLLRLQRFEKKNKKISFLEKRIFLWRENEAEERNVPPNKVFKEKYIKDLSKVVEKKNFIECEWMITNEKSKFNFVNYFK